MTKTIFINYIDHLYERGKNSKFVHIENYINQSKPGSVKSPGETYPFTFVDAIKQYESYEGYNVNIRYCFHLFCLSFDLFLIFLDTILDFLV
jgi:hypothetical protein